MPETKLSSKAQIIYTQFINAEAPQEVRREPSASSDNVGGISAGKEEDGQCFNVIHVLNSSEFGPQQLLNPCRCLQVNLDSETREVLTDRMDTPAADTFVEAQQRIFTLMAKDSFPRFLHSSYYKQTVRGA